MAELLEQEKQTAQGAQTAIFSETPPVPKKKKRNRKKTVRRVIALAAAIALAAGFFVWRRLHPSSDGTAEVLTETVSRGSITSMVRGSGAAVAKNSASITLVNGGKVLEVLVSEGDYVHAGDRLYSIESDNAVSAVSKAEKNLRAAQKELDRMIDASNDLNVRADYAGILMNVKDCPVGEEIVKGTTVATLVDNTKLLLPLYFSYSYENEIAVGQSAAVSVPAAMAQISGVVHEIHKVRRVSDEGGMFFEAVIAVDNPGTLTENMAATATLDVGGETIYPYGPGELSWFRSKALTTEITGSCESSKLFDYMPVQAGESVLALTADSSEDAIEDQETVVRAAEDELEKARENLDALNGIAPIDGTVLSLGVQAGEEVKSGVVAVSIADTTTMIVNAQIDEMYVSYAKAGMPVDIKLWENEMLGTIESVSLTAASENGVARFPMVISVDNSEGKLMSGAYVDYSFTASQSEDCLIVPIQCVKSAQDMNGESVKVLFVQSEGKPESTAELAMDPAEVPEGFWPVVVEVGISDSYNVEILSGVDEGASVYAGTMNADGMGGIGMYF